MRQLRLLPLLLLLLPAIALSQPNVKPDPKELARLSKLDKAQATAKAAFKRDGKSARLRQTYIKATMEVANAYLHTPAVGPKAKYPKSLRYYREVLKVDPKNAEATQNIKMMEDIYRSMGRPIPPG